MAFAVGILGGIKPAAGMRHVAQNVIQNVARSVSAWLRVIPRSRVRVKVELRELRVVVEHLLEMRHEPFGVHGVASETAAKLVVDAAGGHAFAGVQNHLRGLVVVEPFRAAQQKRRNARLRKFRRAAEAAMDRIVNGFEYRRRVLQNVRRQRRI